MTMRWKTIAISALVGVAVTMLSVLGLRWAAWPLLANYSGLGGASAHRVRVIHRIRLVDVSRFESPDAEVDMTWAGLEMKARLKLVGGLHCMLVSIVIGAACFRGARLGANNRSDDTQLGPRSST